MSAINIISGRGKQDVDVNVDDTYFEVNGRGELTLKPIVIAGILPAGAIIETMLDVVPVGTLYCDGASYLKTAYPVLYAAIGDSSGTADALHFNVPDRRGRVGRGVDDGAGVDLNAATRAAVNVGGNVGDNVGSIQEDQILDHTHKQNTCNIAGGGVTAYADENSLTGEGLVHNQAIQTQGVETVGSGTETNVKNSYHKYYIVTGA